MILLAHELWPHFLRRFKPETLLLEPWVSPGHKKEHKPTWRSTGYCQGTVTKHVNRM